MNGTAPRAPDPALAHLLPGPRVYLVAAAKHMRLEFGVPIYLCGSALRVDRGAVPPRDWDIRVHLGHAAFVLRYGITPVQWEAEGQSGNYTEGRWRWSADCIRLVRQWYRRTGLNCDVQVYPEEYALRTFGGQPCVQLDNL